MNSLDIQQQLADQRRGRYVRVSDVDRRLLIDTYKKGEDFIALAKKLNIKRSTARSILRTYIDEGRVSAKQRAGTRLRFITEDEAEMIREMKRRHPLITIGQIQMRLQRTSNRVLSKASISRILTNSIRLGKRAKRSVDGEDDQDGMNETMVNGNDEFMQLSSDENTGGAIFIDDTNDDEEDDDGMIENTSSLNNLDDFQRFMLRKTSVNGDDSMVNENLEQCDDNGYPITYPQLGSEEDEDELSDENEIPTPVDLRSEITSTPSVVNGNTPMLNENGCWNLSTNTVKSEPVCVFVNRNYDENSSDSEHLQEQPLTIDEETNKTINNTLPTISNSHTSNYRRGKCCPICGEKNFSRLSHHLAVTHNLQRHEMLTLLAYTDQNNNNNHPSIASVSGSSPTNTPSISMDKSPQQTPISINTNNQQITCPSSPISESDNHHQSALTTTTTTTITASSSPIDNQSSNYLPVDGKKRLLCPRCDTWVLNLTDHLIKKHHLISKQERLPFLRLARNRYATPSSTPNTIINGNDDKLTTNSFLISPDHSSSNINQTNEHQTHSQQSNILQQAANRKYQNIVRKYRKKFLGSMQPPPSLPSSNHLATSSLSNSNLSSNNTINKSPSLSSYDHSLVHSNLTLPIREQSPTTATSGNHNLLTMNSIQSLLTNNSNNQCKQEKFKFSTINDNFPSRTFSAIKTSASNNHIKDQQQLSTHQKFEQRLTVFRQQFAVTLAMQNSLMQQMELLQRSFVCIEDEWNDMKKQIMS
ncbi:unnamed protein product [Rotaria sordida]|uniref:Uncharacterized protein n=1 Tax=Rotaria sordida TaxID=392033 RepID=A0A818KS97_9BILA|nr:unnamed protein product [Rotaria sordida]CAF3560944.1 unnamed protein product [Rotaria sordida]